MPPGGFEPPIDAFSVLAETRDIAKSGTFPKLVFGASLTQDTWPKAVSSPLAVALPRVPSPTC
jgi:hypothetical protein